MVCSACPLILGVLTLVEYMGNVDVGIDQFFVDH
ncbi:MAG: hypothetical protein ACI89U_002009 [Gammaproteobacteria bacterium]|jgi:hypothetical protein